MSNEAIALSWAVWIIATMIIGVVIGIALRPAYLRWKKKEIQYFLDKDNDYYDK